MEVGEQTDGTPVYTLWVAGGSTDQTGDATRLFTGTPDELAEALAN